MNTAAVSRARWALAELTSPRLARPVPTIVARGIPYVRDGNRLQNLSLYLPATPETSALIGRPAASLPASGAPSRAPRSLVYIHGGAWRDPSLDAASIEPAVAHAFSGFDEASPITAVASLNYTLTQFPTHPGDPYDAAKDRPPDPAREAVHPGHVGDVYRALSLLRSFGLGDQSYILAGHSCGAGLAFQAALQPPSYYGLADNAEVPRPAAVLGLNGLYDLPALVHGLGASHELLSGDYRMMLSNAFGADEGTWSAASPARFDVAHLEAWVRNGHAPRLVLIDQSGEDQLVPVNQRERLEAKLREVSGLRVRVGNRCTGKHAAPWQQGFMLWESICDALRAMPEV